MFSKKKAATVILLLALFLVSACTNGESSNSLKEIEEAIEKNTDLDNGVFIIVHTMSNPDQSHEQKIEGSFIKEGSTNYNWRRATYNDGQDEQNFTEIVEIDGIQFQRIVLAGQGTEWQETPNSGSSLREYLKPLFEVEELDIESISSHEENNVDIYTIVLKDSYGDQVKEENINALQQNLEILEENGASEAVMQNVELQIESYEQTTYSDFEYIYQIDKNGYLISVQMNSKVTEPGNSMYELTNTYSFTAYNLSDKTNLIPEIE